MSNDVSKSPLKQNSRRTPSVQLPGASSTRQQRLIFGAAVVSAAALSFQFGSPLTGAPSVGPLGNGILLLTLTVGLIWHYKHSPFDQKIAICWSFASILHLLIAGQCWAFPPRLQLASRWGASLSSTWVEIPLLGVAHGWAAICLGWLCYHLLLIVGEERTPLAKTSAALTAFVITGLGVHGLIGYVSGNTSLFSA